jgi:MFS transporter, putative metabolite:H+ symporter
VLQGKKMVRQTSSKGIPTSGPSAVDAAKITEHDIVARIERLPLSRWHLRAVGLIGLASFFDAFDSLTIAFVMPVLSAAWNISASAVGILISVGFVGQLLGAILLTHFAEQFGRLRTLRWSIVILAGLSVACAFAGAFVVLLALRFLQGFGLGAEVPIAATYINESCPARFRGRLVFLLELTFATGVMVTSLVALWIIPHLGWRWMFAIGGLPLVLALALGRILPESPRWLARQQRLQEAENGLVLIEAAILAEGKKLSPPSSVPVPSGAERASLIALFADGYARRTIVAWAIMFCTSVAGYGLITWLPTIYRTVYHLDVSRALQFSFIGGVAGVLAAVAGTAVIDVIGRRWTFTIAFVGCAIPLFILARTSIGSSIQLLVTLATISVFFISVLLAGTYAYLPEIYPTRMRALGTGVGSAWLRIGSIVAPLSVGLLLTYTSVGKVFLLFAVAAALGAIVVWFCLIETRGRPLEDIAR